MRVGIVVIASNENLYLRDFVEYYKSIGVDNIILGDNSPIDGDFPQLVIGDYINSGFVTYINYRGYNKDNWQTDFYNVTINKYKDQFDWLCVFDIDEYLTFNNKAITNIKDFLSLDIFEGVGQIKVNWIVYNDNEQLYYENKPVMERFPNRAEPITFLNREGHYPENTTTKVIVNCKNSDIIEFVTPHICFTIKRLNEVSNAFLKAVNCSGIEVNPRSGCAAIDINNAQLNHYQSLSITEFLYRRCSRDMKKLAWTKENTERNDRERMITMFFNCNKVTDEKMKIIEDFFNTSGKNYS